MIKPSSYTEMGLEDLLNDPLVALVMLCDGVNAETLRRELYAVRNRLKMRDRTAVEI